MSVASVTASFPPRNSRARNGESSASACENFWFHGHTSWEMCRYNRFEIPLSTGRLTRRKAGSELSSPEKCLHGECRVCWLDGLLLGLSGVLPTLQPAGYDVGRVYCGRGVVVLSVR
jgi:hypothetical protein